MRAKSRLRTLFLAFLDDTLADIAGLLDEIKSVSGTRPSCPDHLRPSSGTIRMAGPPALAGREGPPRPTASEQRRVVVAREHPVGTAAQVVPAPPVVGVAVGPPVEGEVVGTVGDITPRGERVSGVIAVRRDG